MYLTIFNKELMMKVSIGSDHGGFELKGAPVKALSGAYEMTDRGPADNTSCDYPDYAVAVAKDVALGAADFGILVCRSGIGMAMAAHRFQHVRADDEIIRLDGLCAHIGFVLVFHIVDCRCRANTAGSAPYSAASAASRPPARISRLSCILVAMAVPPQRKPAVCL